MSLSIKPRVVIDTNVLISGVLWGGKPGLVIKNYRQSKFTLFVSPFILGELANFLEEYHVKKEQREIILNEFKTKSIKIIPSRKIKICRDEKDNQVLDLAFDCRADYLITGDKDLLSLGTFKQTKILKPKEFLKIFTKS
ncbi:putative toxin-antitoxin system toxin component, PIN family [Candidatus Gottesmanbacteria bacterium]|nr:putative toxin-antitoxin system toxin component, PIN family [Candidatus Gottesmanbacteria bacterium]